MSDETALTLRLPSTIPMRHLPQTLFRGLTYAAQAWLALPLYLSGLALGLIQTWPAARAGAAGTLLEPMALGDTDAFVRLLLSGRPLAPGTFAWLPIALVAVLCYACVYNLVSGGALSVMAGRRRFRTGCARFFWSLTGVGIILTLLGLLALIAAVLGGMLAGLGVGVAIALVFLQLISLLGEYGRAMAVTTDRRSPLAALGGATRFVGRHLPGALGLAAPGLLLHWGVAALAGAADQRAGYAAPLPQQAAALAWVWVKQLRLGWALAYLETAGAASAARGSYHDVPASP